MTNYPDNFNDAAFDAYWGDAASNDDEQPCTGRVYGRPALASAEAMARLEAGETVRAVADALSIAASSVVNWSERKPTTGSLAPGKIGGDV
jgi:hypothetical protein